VAHSITGIFRFLQQGEGEPIHLSVVTLVEMLECGFVVNHKFAMQAFLPFSAYKTHEKGNQIPQMPIFFAK
jgi:hypothetical protein